MSPADRERFPAIWVALQMGPMPPIDARSDEEIGAERAANEAAMKAAGRDSMKLLAVAGLVIVGLIVIAIVLAVVLK